MDTKKNIVTLIVIGIVFWVFWIVGAQTPVTSLQADLGLKNISQVTGGSVANIQPVSLAGHPELGNYLTDASGRTLYVTTKTDCTGNCLIVWPPYVARDLVSADNGALGVAENKDAGLLQYTWNGKLLYYYAEDKKPGDILGQGIGNVWFLVR